MAIQMRRGNYADFDPTRMVEGAYVSRNVTCASNAGIIL